MKKKILMGSAIAVTILIGVSFTSVVGYKSVESCVKASPLFNIRSSRAIDEENEGLSCEYVGCGEDVDIPIPNRNEKTILIQNLFEILKQKNYDKIKNLFLQLKNKLQIDGRLNGLSPYNIKELIQQYKDNDNPKNKNDDIEINLFTVNDACPITTEPNPLVCRINFLFFVIGVIIINILYIPIEIAEFLAELRIWIRVAIEVFINYLYLIGGALIDALLEGQWTPGSIIIYLTLLLLLTFFIYM